MQEGDCCWAICVATVIGYLYYKETEDPKFDLSCQDILDRVWIYYEDEVRHKARDSKKCYRCKPGLGYTYVKNYGVGFLEDYPFEKAPNEEKDEIDLKTEFPRVFTGEYRKLNEIQEVIDCLKKEKQAVIGAIQVTEAFVNYKKVSVYLTLSI
ncbi:hypothetical protein POM88_022766 [Heracleum sosnowskyi]|uniref:Peptidase C1A papain C-terminal domain-containing protein n=1 Tax=Heracleum sosnowskyi TaxID=360622 RepID=A0AAD8IHG6_9APIA|nr:hypothetical protein POM88_022766 [Heracleum sosnowskyi]